jgi:thioredoxin reductase (NADPH)
MSDTEAPPCDAIVVGAGPAGLSAALYLARFRRSTLVLHDGRARALRIPLTHNAPGFPEGVTGSELVARMGEHAARYGATIAQGHIVRAERVDGLFRLTGSEGEQWQARALILATGLELNQIDLPWEVHEAAIRAGVLRYCPVCDGHEHIDKAIAVIGCDEQGAAEALFLRTYSERITLLPRSFPELAADEREQLRAAGVRVIESPVVRHLPHADGFDIDLADGERLRFDVVYPALGTQPRSGLARMLGLAIEEDGCIPADALTGSAVPGLYCAGDVLVGLDQISVAMGHGAVAATKAHNWLREQDGEALHHAPAPQTGALP